MLPRLSVTLAGERYLGRAIEISERIPQAHPRLLCRPEHLERLRSPQLEPRLAGPIAAIRSQAQASVRAPLVPISLPEDMLVPGGQTWDQRAPASVETMDANRRMMEPVGTASIAVPCCALYYRISGEVVYRDQAREAMRLLAAVDLIRTSYTNTHRSRS